MDCDTARQALSARIDGEREPIPAARADEHLTECESCRQWHAAAVAQTQMLRRLAGRSQLSEVRAAEQRRRHRQPALRPESWPRWALGAVGLIQLVLAIAHGLLTHLAAEHPHSGGHVLNEYTAWSAALGVAMLAAALRPAVALGLAWVLGTFTLFLAGYETIDGLAGRVTGDGVLAHLPVAVGAVLALLVWRRGRTDGPHPKPQATVTDEIVLPDNASRGRRRGHLRSTDGSAA